MDSQLQPDNQAKLRSWFLARLRKQCLAEEGSINLTPAGLVKADREMLESLISQAKLKKKRSEPKSLRIFSSKHITSNFVLGVALIALSELDQKMIPADDNSWMLWFTSAILFTGLFLCVISFIQMKGRIDAAADAINSRLPQAKVLPDNFESAVLLTLLELDKSAERERLIADFPAVVACAFTDELEIAAISPSCKRGWGYHPGNLLGQSLRQYMPTKDVTKLQSDIVQARNSLQEMLIEGSLRNADGHHLDVRWNVEWSQTHKLYFAVCSDVTEEVKAKRLAQDFFALMTHDLKAPLATIECVLVALECGLWGELAETARERVHMAKETTDYLAALVDNVLQLHRLELFHAELDLTEHQSVDLVSDAVSYVQPLCEEKHLRLTESVENLKLHVEPIAIKRVITNLLSNAIKFSPEDGLVSITLKQTSDTEVAISISDSGCGITPQELKLIFDPFQQGSHGKLMEGTGLGLAVCDRIVRAHGGSITVESEPERGSTFTVHLPCVLQPVSQSARAEQT